MHSGVPRTQETVLQVVAGFKDAIMINRGVSEDAIYDGSYDHQEKRIVSTQTQMLGQVTFYENWRDLAEPIYRDLDGKPDDGAFLVAQAYCPEVNEGFEGYRWMAEQGFRGSRLSEYPLDVANRGLRCVLRSDIHVQGSSITIAGTHQWNIEAMAASLSKEGLGEDGNQLFENAGGGFPTAGILKLRIEHKHGNVKEAAMYRITNGVSQQMELNMDTLRGYGR